MQLHFEPQQTIQGEVIELASDGGSIGESDLVCQDRSEHIMLRDEGSSRKWTPGDDVVSSKRRTEEA